MNARGCYSKDTALTEKQQTLVTEVVAMQMEETFGSEDAINRLVGEKPNLAKRILERIKAFLKTFGKSTGKDPEAVKQLRHTEELFRKALEKAGVGYAAEELTRMNEKNVQVSEENGGEGVDDGAEARYNGGEVKKSAKIVKYIPYSAVGQNHSDAIRRQLIRLYEGIESGVADGVAIENGDAILVVDSGKENGSVRFGVRKKITIKNDERRNRYVQRINQESADNGFGDRTVFKRLGADLDHNSGSNVGRELREDKANTSKHSSNNKNGVPDGASNRGVSVSRPQIKKSRKHTGETVTISKGEMAKLHANYAGDKVFTKKEVAAAVKSLDALQKLPAQMRNELVTHLWTGYNERLNQQGFEMFTELAWHQIHAEVLQATPT